ncbi:sulfurtransferase TusA family protein [Thiomicrospira sp. ALE5]|uniref:sulfurtransferase TusA family protein n=1 Tax=Thiomicrospira sp. ALE5 TaxID=748650 RepID=UPI0008E64633|nr:sulfurtransferase TusA family protein [Thiomicrospira sp. ALE5]SFR63069.1 tRNA 2-thiouridine synthesizing protein A [Thiomicrospira sp. ALE5]
MQKVNLIGLKCPLPLIKFKKALVEYADEVEFHVSVDDPGALKDFPVFCNKLGLDFDLLAEQPLMEFRISRHRAT